MQNPLNLIASSLSSNALTGMGPSTGKDKAELDASALEGLTDQFAGLLNQALQQQVSPASFITQPQAQADPSILSTQADSAPEALPLEEIETVEPSLLMAQLPAQPEPLQIATGLPIAPAPIFAETLENHASRQLQSTPLLQSQKATGVSNATQTPLGAEAGAETIAPESRGSLVSASPATKAPLEAAAFEAEAITPSIPAQDVNLTVSPLMAQYITFAPPSKFAEAGQNPQSQPKPPIQSATEASNSANDALAPGLPFINMANQAASNSQTTVDFKKTIQAASPHLEGIATSPTTTQQPSTQAAIPIPGMETSSIASDPAAITQPLPLAQTAAPNQATAQMPMTSATQTDALPEGLTQPALNDSTQTLPLSPPLESSATGTVDPSVDLTRFSQQTSLPLAASKADQGASPQDKRTLRTDSTTLINDATAKPLSGLQQQLEQLQGTIEHHSTAMPINQLNSISTDIPTDAPAEQSTMELRTEPTQADSTQIDTPQVPVLEGLSPAPSHNQSTFLQAENIFTSMAEGPAEQVSEGVVYSAKNGHKELTIRLNPDNLGEVRLNFVSNSNNELSARLIATSPESHDLLKGQLEGLRHSLEAQGVKVENLSVILAGSLDSGHDASQNNTDQSFRQEQQNTQQQNSQQQFNQQHQPDTRAFAQFGGQSQHKQGFAQHPAYNPSNAGNTTVEGTVRPSTPADKNDNGRISILA